MLEKITKFLVALFLINISASPVFGLYDTEISSKEKFLSEMIELIQEKYIDDISEEKMIEYALDGMLSSLDPYSMYLDKKSFSDIKSSLNGEFGGIGLELMSDSGLLKVISPYEHGSAFKAGIRAGDYISTIDGKQVSTMTMASAISMLRGKAGTTVSLKIIKSDGTHKSYKIKRGMIKLIPVRSKILGHSTIGYMNISIFNNKTAVNVKKDYLKLIKLHPKLKGLILDLRWNPGGTLEQAVSVTDLFLCDAPIVLVQGKNPEEKILYEAGPSDISYGIPMVVLINRGTASAAEIVASALQSNKRAIVMGERSFGKASVQSILKISNDLLKQDVGIKITTARYFTASGNSIDGIGVTPNIEVVDREAKNARAKIEETDDIQLLRAADIIEAMFFIQKD